MLLRLPLVSASPIYSHPHILFEFTSETELLFKKKTLQQQKISHINNFASENSLSVNLLLMLEQRRSFVVTGRSVLGVFAPKSSKSVTNFV